VSLAIIDESDADLFATGMPGDQSKLCRRSLYRIEKEVKKRGLKRAPLKKGAINSTAQKQKAPDS
jgi:hypothetical protein